MRKDNSTRPQIPSRPLLDLRRAAGRASEFGAPPRVLAVGLADQIAIFRALESSGFPVAQVEGCRALREHLQKQPTPDVVVTATSLRDGNWCDILQALNSFEADAALILSSPIADQGLWSEAIWRGVHDVLVMPLDPTQVMSSIESALRASPCIKESASAMHA